MRTQRIPMSIDEFHALPRHYAWKHEYMGGTAHIRPRELVHASLTDAAPEALARLYRLAFRDTPDLCDYVGEILEREIQRWLTKDIACAHPVSLILRPKRHPRSVAALLENGFLLDTLAVRPRYQR